MKIEKQLEQIPYLLDENGNQVTDLEGKKRIAQALFDEIDNDKKIFGITEDGTILEDEISEITGNNFIIEID